MAKAKKVSKQGKAIRSKVQAALESAAPAFKVNVKHVKALAVEVWGTIKAAGETVRDRIVTWKGERPETLEALKEQIAIEGKAYLKSAARKVKDQSVYNIISDLKACCNGYQKYAEMNKDQAAKFDKLHDSYTDLRDLVAYLRAVAKGKKKSKAKGNAKVERIKSAWKNHKQEQLKKAKDLIRYADTDSIGALIDFAEAIIKGRRQGNVSKMQQRKAA